MKNTFALLVAVLSFIFASSLQAAEAEFEFYSQVAGQRLTVAEDVHYAVVDAAGAKVAEGSLKTYQVVIDVMPGEYNLVVEQASTRFSGSIEISIAEENVTKLFKLDHTGLLEIMDAHECPCENDGKNHNCQVKGGCEGGDCFCDKDCICKRIDSLCDPNNIYAPKSTTGTETGLNSSPNTISNPTYQTANPNLPQTPNTMGGGLFGSGSSIGGLGMLGMIGAVIAIAVADDDGNYKPDPSVSARPFYR